MNQEIQNTTRSQTVYSDCSVKDGAAISAWYVSRACFGATRVPVQGNVEAETLAALYALRLSQGPVTVITDAMVVCEMLKMSVDGAAWAGACAKNPALEELRNELDARGASLTFRPGHSTRETPAGLKFCYELSRAVSRQAKAMDLQVGDAVVGQHQAAKSPDGTRVRFAVASPRPHASILRHLRTSVLPELAVAC